MGIILNRFSFADESDASRYMYDEDTDKAYFLINNRIVKKMGWVVDHPEKMPYYVELEDRLARIGVWLFDVNDPKQYI